MELRHLRAFLAVAADLHFGRAARTLHVAQPALSRTIRDLEDELGLRLFERSKHRVTLTEAGLDLRRHGGHLLEECQRAVESCQRAARGETGRLRIGFIGSLSYELLPNLMQTFHRHYADVELELVEAGPTEQRELLFRQRIDCGFIGLLPDTHEETLDLTLVAQERLMIALPKDHPLAEVKALWLKDLQNESLLLTGRENAPEYNPWLLDLCRKAGLEPRLKQEDGRAATVLCLVAAGLGYSIFPRPISAAATSAVVFRYLEDALPLYHYALASLHNDKRPALRHFIDLASQSPLE
jgi:DNA-binding transcriptional LysR family regulator